MALRFLLTVVCVVIPFILSRGLALSMDPRSRGATPSDVKTLQAHVSGQLPRDSVIAEICDSSKADDVTSGRHPRNISSSPCDFQVILSLLEQGWKVYIAKSIIHLWDQYKGHDTGSFATALTAFTLYIKSLLPEGFLKDVDTSSGDEILLPLQDSSLGKLLIGIARYVLRTCPMSKPSECCPSHPNYKPLSLGNGTGPCSYISKKTFVYILALSLDLGANDNRSVTQTTFSGVCWEPELSLADQLYQLKGKWDISFQCLRTVETIAKEVLGNMMTNYLQLLAYDSIEYRKHNDLFRMMLPHLVTAMDIFSHDLQDPIWQLVFHSAFSRFHDVIISRHNGSDSTTVSCAGLRGNPTEVFEAVMRILRMVIVNEARYRCHASGFLRKFYCPMMFSVLHDHLPCYVSTALNLPLNL